MSDRSNIPVPDIDLVRKLRPAYIGIPDDAPFERHLLIWSLGDGLRAAFVSEAPESFSYCDSMYHLQQPYAGDWDALVDPAGRLVGVSVSPPADEPLLSSAFLRRHNQLRFIGGELRILLCLDADYEVECVQGIGTRFYSDSSGNYVFLFPEWSDWGDVAFPLASGGVPLR